MSANAIGKYFPTAAAKGRRYERGYERERRASVRTAVHWPVILRHGQSDLVHSVTENLSSQGFYCLAQMPVASGASVLGWLTIPTYDPSGRIEKVVLECKIRVVRSDEAPTEGLYGIACRIEEYRVGITELGIT